MYDRRIVPALAVMGMLMSGLYALAWWQIVTVGARPPEPTEQAPAQPPPASDHLFYRVTTSKGDTHIIEVSRIDAAQAVLTATERYGEGATVERIEGGEVAEHQRSEAGLGPSPLVWTGFLILLPLTLLLAAARLSARGAAVKRVWRSVSGTLTGKGEAVQAEARVDDAGLQQALDAINRWRKTELRWDRPSDRIMDLRLAHFTLALRYCPRCNTQVHARISADLSLIPSCLSCMAPLEGQELEQQQAQIVARLVDDGARSDDGEASAFSPGVFMFWSVLFPPLAAAYALRAAR